jgi:hypothetical protein
MRCGNCKGQHPNADAIRECYRGKYARKTDPSMDLKTPEYVAEIQRRERADDERAYASKDAAQALLDEEDAAKRVLDGMSKASGVKEPMWPPSDAQITYVLGLQDERDLPVNWLTYTESDLKAMERSDVSGAIAALKRLPRKDGHTGRRTWTMPDGRYCLDSKGALGFFEVTHGKAGSRWDGYTFVKRLIGSPGDYSKLPMNKSLVDETLRRIEKDPKAAAIRFGKETKHCFRCASPLTHKRSRAAGYGEKCASIMGWEW